MGWIVTTIIFVIVLVAGFFLGKHLVDSSDETRESNAQKARGNQIQTWCIVGIVAWVSLRTLFAIFHPIPAGYVGVVYQFNDIIGQIPSGLQITAPWQDVEVASIQTRVHRFREKEDINTFSKQSQDVYTKTTLNYKVSPEAIQSLYRNVGSDWFNTLVPQRYRDFIKSETVKFDTVDVPTHREAIRVAVKNKLIALLAPYSIEIEDLFIDDIDFNPEFKHSIEQKQIASQEALRELERIKQREYEAKQAFEVARGRANAIREEANGQAEANHTLAASLSPEIIQFQAVQKLADNIQVAIIPAGATLIDPTNLLRGGQQPTR